MDIRFLSSIVVILWLLSIQSCDQTIFITEDGDGFLIESLVSTLKEHPIDRLAIAGIEDIRFLTRLKERITVTTDITPVDKTELDGLLANQRDQADLEIFERKTVDRIRKFEGYSGWNYLLSCKRTEDDRSLISQTLSLSCRCFAIQSGDLLFARLIEKKVPKVKAIAVFLILSGTILTILLVLIVRTLFRRNRSRFLRKTWSRRIELRSKIIVGTKNLLVTTTNLVSGIAEDIEQVGDIFRLFSASLERMIDDLEASPLGLDHRGNIGSAGSSIAAGLDFLKSIDILDAQLRRVTISIVNRQGNVEKTTIDELRNHFERFFEDALLYIQETKG